MAGSGVPALISTTGDNAVVIDCEFVNKLVRSMGRYQLAIEWTVNLHCPRHPKLIRFDLLSFLFSPDDSRFHPSKEFSRHSRIQPRLVHGRHKRSLASTREEVCDHSLYLGEF